jgi:outer membrane protein assembly factor BamB
MPKAKHSPKSAAKKRPKKIQARKGGGKFVLLFSIVGLILLAEIFALVRNKVGEDRIFTVAKTLEFTGDNQPCGPFQAWDLLAMPEKIAISDQEHKRLLIFDLQGKWLSEIDSKQAGPPTFSEVSCLTDDAAGNLYVMDTWNGLIRGFDPKDKPLPIVNLNNKGFYGPRGLAYDGTGFVIADTGSHRVVKVSPTGEVLASWGKHGSGKLEFNNPYQVVLDGDGNSYVLDQDNHRIQCLDPKGRFLREFKLGTAPTAEAIDSKRNLLYVSSAEGQFVKVYSLSGDLIGTLTEAGPKGKALPGFRALSVLPDGELAATDQGRVMFYRSVPKSVTP